jgi:phospholysine phosphohistidine inorganic pyrophosphate phosphatase
MAALLIDLDGVVYLGDEPIPGAVDALRTLAARGVPHLFVTNTTSKPRAAIVEHLHRLGIDVAADRILTPPIAALRWLERHTPGPAMMFVPEVTRRDFDGIECVEPGHDRDVQSVVVGDLAADWSFDRINQAFRALMREHEPAFVALGLTRYWRTQRGLQLDVGPFVKALEYATGRQAHVLGKPSRTFFETALDVLGSTAETTLMIGDDVIGDVGGAQRAGLRGALVRTGKFRPTDLDGEVTPDLVLDSLGALPERLPELFAGG